MTPPRPIPLVDPAGRGSQSRLRILGPGDLVNLMLAAIVAVCVVALALDLGSWLLEVVL